MRKELLEKLIVTYLVYKSALCVCVKKIPDCVCSEPHESISLIT